ncbi:Apoptosis-associated speck-like protein containing a CARD [Merluccius polli]|uniref:Apoptosis-associated speck-like protein containing a CARD n=1 Tax=Merluccius polli TaxID=89951 RepID=A0AA47M116_MERPO|nr:Apoptosis-associated speck-like protein containing a CARD [Merluccius polli]
MSKKSGCLKRKASQRKAEREKKGRQLITFSKKGIYSRTFPLVPLHVAAQQGSRLPLIVWRVWELIKAVTVVILVSPEEHFVDRHRSSLIQRISSVAAILDQLLDHKVVSQEQYDTILTKATRQNQVRELYSGALRSSGTRGKDIFLSVLEELEPFLIEDLRGQCRPVPPCESWHYGLVRLSLVSPEEHFVDRHRSSLIQRISLVAAILDQLLDHKVVSQEQYDTILAKATRQDQVRELYSGALRSSGTRGKDIFLSVLEKTDHLLIEDLSGQGYCGRGRGRDTLENAHRCASKAEQADNRRADYEVLIIMKSFTADMSKKMKSGCLKRKASQRKAEREKKGRQLVTFSKKGIYSRTFPLVPLHVAAQQGSRLPLIVWRVWEFIKAVTVVILVSPEKHFVDRHRSSLIQRISLVAAILDQLLDHKVVSQEQYDTILTKATRQDQVRELYSGALRSSGTRGKDIFLSVLEELEPFLIEDLRGQCRPVPPLSPEEHFVDRHRSSLVQRISSVAAILDQLLDHKVVSQEQYDTILAKATRQDQVRELYRGALRSSGTRGKDIFLCVLEELEPFLIEDLRGQCRPVPPPKEHFVDRHCSSLVQRISLMDQLLDQKVVSQEQYDTILTKATRQDQVRELYSGALRSSGRKRHLPQCAGGDRPPSYRGPEGKM